MEKGELRIKDLVIYRNFKVKRIRVIAFIIIMLACNELHAQKIGVKVGYNLSTVERKSDDQKFRDKLSAISGFQLGAILEYSLKNKKISFESGIFLTNIGYLSSFKDDGFSGPGVVENHINLLYLEIPITGRASYDIGAVEMFGILGPYVRYGLSGMKKSETILDSGEQFLNHKLRVEWGNKSYNDFKRLDYGLVLGAGVSIDSVELCLNYSLGMANLAPQDNKGYKLRNRVFSIIAGYKF